MKPAGEAAERRPAQPFYQRLPVPVKRPDAPAPQRAAGLVEPPEIPGHLATAAHLRALAPSMPRKSS